MKDIQLSIFTVPLCALAIGLAAGCSDDGGGAEPPCNWVFDPDECRRTNGTGDEVGDGDGDPEDEDDGDGDGEPEGNGLSDSCAADDGKRSRTVFQCNGSLSASIAFNTVLGDCGKTLGDPGWCDEEHDFGLGFESYDRPAVMACCDAEGSPEEEILRMCSVDMVEQICLSVPKRLQMLIENGVIKVGKKQARALRDWLNDNTQACYDALNRQSDVPGALEPATWLVNGGKNKGWASLKNFRVKIEQAAVTTATLPESEGEYIECWDNDFNNTEVFEDFVPVSPGINSVTHLADAGEVVIAGPLINDREVVGAGTLAPRSSMEVTTHDLDWTLEDMSIFADGPVSVSFDYLTWEVERAALRLYGVSHGSFTTGLYIIDVGKAHFLISGVSRIAAQGAGVRWATNSTPIIAHRLDDGWRFDPFDVTHVDSVGYVWTVTIPETKWD